jgi:hypothetical protein
LNKRETSANLHVFDKTVIRDPRLNDQSLWDGSDLEEIKRVNPELIRLLANLSPKEIEPLSANWFVSDRVRIMVPHWETKRLLDERRFPQSVIR